MQSQPVAQRPQRMSGLVDVFVYHGYDVAHAADGNTGLQLALSGRHDLVLLDVMLPGTSGIDICRTIRRDRNLPIIILSARTDETDRVLGALAGVGDLGHFERMQRVARPARRPAAILFADLEASSPLARRLPTASSRLACWAHSSF